jgi:uncharacterized protein YxeA
MKNIIIAILVAIILILGFLFFTQKKSNVNYEPWPETEPATVKPTTNNTTNNYPVQNNSKGNNYYFNPKAKYVGAQRKAHSN